MTGRSLAKVGSPPLGSDHRFGGFGTRRCRLSRRVKDTRAVCARIHGGLSRTRRWRPRVHHCLFAFGGLSTSLNTRVSCLNDVRNLLRTHFR